MFLGIAMGDKIYKLDTLSLSSDPISRLSGVNELRASDWWILERSESENVDCPLWKEQYLTQQIDAILAENVSANPTSLIYKETRDLIEGTAHHSWKIDYESLSSRIMHDVSCRYNFNTMAYKDKWEYSRANHSHDYSLIACYPHVTYDDVVKAYAPNTQIMTYNIARGGHSKIRDPKFDLMRTISTIKRGQPTIICLQEVDMSCSTTGSLDFLATIKTYLGPSWNCAYMPTINLGADRGGGQHGIGMLYQGSAISVSNLSIGNDYRNEMRGMQIAEFDEFVVANVHPTGGASDNEEAISCRNANLSAIHTHFTANTYDGKAIFIAGDWNDTPENVLKIMTDYVVISNVKMTTTMDNKTYDFIIADKAHAHNVYNIKNYIIDDLIASDHKPSTTSFFYNDDYTKLDEWLASMKIWKLSAWEEVKSNGRWNYKVLHKDYVPTQYDIYYPHIEFPKYRELEIGEMRFFGRNSLPTIDDKTNPRIDETGLLYDSEYDAYWAYPNGQTISCQTFEFQDACKIYGNDRKDGNDTSFTIPLLDKFFRCCYPGMTHTTHSVNYIVNSIVNTKCDVLVAIDVGGDQGCIKDQLAAQMEAFINEIVIHYLHRSSIADVDLRIAIYGYGNSETDEEKTRLQINRFVSTIADAVTQATNLVVSTKTNKETSTYQYVRQMLTEVSWRKDAHKLLFAFTGVSTKMGSVAVQMDIQDKLKSLGVKLYICCDPTTVTMYENIVKRNICSYLSIKHSDLINGSSTFAQVVDEINNFGIERLEYKQEQTTTTADVVPLQYFASQTSVPNHSHRLVDPTTIGPDGSSSIQIIDDFILSGSIYGTSTVDQSTKLTHSGGMPRSVENGDHDAYLTELSIDLKEWGSTSHTTFTDFSDSSINIDTYPTHQHMPAIVYVGKR